MKKRLTFLTFIVILLVIVLYGIVNDGDILLEFRKKSYDVIFLDENGKVTKTETLVQNEFSKYLEIIKVDYKQKYEITSTVSSVSIATNAKENAQVTCVLNNTFEDRVIKSILFALTQGSIWNTSGYSLNNMTFIRYRINKSGQYEVLSDCTWEKVKEYINLLQKELDSFTITINTN